MKYRTIVADPPWEYEDGTGASYSSRGRRDCDLPYPTMSVDEIAALPDFEAQIDVVEHDAQVLVKAADLFEHATRHHHARAGSHQSRPFAILPSNASPKTSPL